MKYESCCFKTWAADDASFNVLCIVPQSLSHLVIDPVHSLLFNSSTTGFFVPAYISKVMSGRHVRRYMLVPPQLVVFLPSKGRPLGTSHRWWLFPTFLNTVFSSALKVSSVHSTPILKKIFAVRLQLSITWAVKVIPFSPVVPTFHDSILSNYRYVTD